MKFLKYFYVMFFTFLLTFGSVNLYYTGKPYLNQEGYEYRIYLIAQENGFDGDYQSWLDSITGRDASPIELRVSGEWLQWKYENESDEAWRSLINVLTLVGLPGNDGTNGVTPHIGENGHWWIGTVDTGVAASVIGMNGEDGVTPHIGENGHWWIGDIDTNVVAEAVDGQNGASAFEIFLTYYPDYQGTEAEWIDDIINGNLILKTFHTVSFDSMGGSPIPNQIIEDGKKVSKPIDPVKDDYSFVDWYYGSERWVFIGYIVTEDMVLTADWEQVVFDPAPFIPENLTYAQDVNNFWSIPSLGTPKVLVVPVEFPDVRFSNPSTVTANIQTAFNGQSTSSFESLNSFYKTSSFDQLDLTGQVLQPFLTANNSSYYQNLSNFSGNTAIINEIMAAYNSTIDFKDYDYNNDGRLDGIFMIYSRQNGTWGTFWWAYLSSYQGSTRYDGVIPTSYVWMPYNFVLVNNVIESKTFIHETGHMLGLEDYYDYNEGDGSGNEYGLGGADMMDYSLGDHNPWSKMILGWIQPRVVTESMSVELLPYITTGEALIITDKWNGTLFDEYIIAMYFTNEGFYKDIDFYFDSQPGLVLYHVDARLGPTAKVNSAYPSTPFINNNTDTPNKLIKYIEADGNNSLISTGYVWAADVYRPGNIFNGNRNIGYSWHQSSRGLVRFTIHFVAEANGSIQLTMTYAS
jgi:M6 family metalloprotease-like protein